MKTMIMTAKALGIGMLADADKLHGKMVQGRVDRLKKLTVTLQERVEKLETRQKTREARAEALLAEVRNIRRQKVIEGIITIVLAKHPTAGELNDLATGALAHEQELLASAEQFKQNKDGRAEHLAREEALLERALAGSYNRLALEIEAAGSQAAEPEPEAMPKAAEPVVAEEPEIPLTGSAVPAC